MCSQLWGECLWSMKKTSICCRGDGLELSLTDTSWIKHHYCNDLSEVVASDVWVVLCEGCSSSKEQTTIKQRSEKEGNSREGKMICSEVKDELNRANKLCRDKVEWSCNLQGAAKRIKDVPHQQKTCWEVWLFSEEQYIKIITGSTWHHGVNGLLHPPWWTAIQVKLPL